MKAFPFLACWVLALLGGGGLQCEAKKYKQGKAVPVYYNRVGPYHNPTETYQFYNLPFCQPSQGKEYKLLDLGEVSAHAPGSCQSAVGAAVLSLWAIGAEERCMMSREQAQVFVPSQMGACMMS